MVRVTILCTLLMTAPITAKADFSEMSEGCRWLMLNYLRNAESWARACKPNRTFEIAGLQDRISEVAAVGAALDGWSDDLLEVLDSISANPDLASGFDCSADPDLDAMSSVKLSSFDDLRHHALALAENDETHGIVGLCFK